MPFVDQGRKTERICPSCGETFFAYGKIVCCSFACAGKQAIVPRYEVTCPGCSKINLRTQNEIKWHKIYCSAACVAAANAVRQRQRILRICERCGKEFETIPARLKQPNGARFCSYSCSNKRDPLEKGNRAGVVLDRSRPALVYLATNLINGNRYLGVTTLTLEQRASSHFRQALQPSGARARGKSPFMAAIRKYGRDMFRFAVLRKCTDMVEAFDEEVRLIAILGPEYNVSAGGEGAVGVPKPRGALSPNTGKPGYWLGKKRDAATVEKMRVAATGRKLNLSEPARELRRMQAAAMRLKRFSSAREVQ